MVQSIWVARLKISRAVAHKISTRHGLHANEIRDAVQCVAGLPFRWDDDPERGRRAVVQTVIRGWKVAIVLYPTNDALEDTYNLGSAYRIP
jgi:hypothetical protein